jgi:hypothetical protein
MIDETIWKEEVVAYSRYYPSIFLESKGMIQTKRDTLVLQVGGWARG